MSKLDDAKRRLGATMVDEIGQKVAENKARGRLEAEALARVLTCRREGHVRNPDLKCVRCYDVAPEPGYEST